MCYTYCTCATIKALLINSHDPAPQIDDSPELKAPHGITNATLAGSVIEIVISKPSNINGMLGYVWEMCR